MHRHQVEQHEAGKDALDTVEPQLGSTLKALAFSLGEEYRCVWEPEISHTLCEIMLFDQPQPPGPDRIALSHDDYLVSRRALGVRLRTGSRVLRQFVRETGDPPLDEVTPQAVSTFLRGRSALSATWTTKHRVLGGLNRFAIARGYVDVSPLPAHSPKLPPQQTPTCTRLASCGAC